MNEHRPVYRIAAAGLDPRDVRLIEIVFKHSQYNRFAFVLDPVIEPDRTDILIVDTADPEGLRAVATVRGLARHVPVIAAVQRGIPSATRHAISIDRLTLQLLPILNRVVETELLSPETQPMTMPMTLPLPTLDAAAFLVRPAASAWPAAEPAAAPGARTEGASGAGAATERRASGSAAPTPVAASPSSRQPMPSSGPAARASGASNEAMSGQVLPGRASSGEPLPGQAAAGLAPPSQGPSGPLRPAPGGRTAAAQAPVGQSPTGQASSTAAGAAPADAARRRHSGAAGDGGTPTRSNLVEFPRSATQRGPGPRIRVLVVDDSPTVRQQLGVAFTRMGLVCEMVSNGAQALERLEASHFDLAMVDVVIPDMDGYRLTREMRKRRRGMPVIILSSRSSPFDYARGMLAGCKAYLAKPVPLRQLEAAMRKVLRKSLAIDELPERLRDTGERRRAAADAARSPAGASSAPDPHFAAGQGRRA